MDRGAATAPDSRLVPILDDIEGADASGLLARLIADSADPIIQRIVRTKLITRLDPADGRDRTQDALELQNDIRVRILTGLRTAAGAEAPVPIVDFSAYVAVISYNACNEYLRRKHPERARLKDRLRYVFKRREGLALWHDPRHGWLCGRAAWRAEHLAPTSIPRAAEDWPAHPDLESELEQSVTAWIDRANAPVAFNALLEMMYGSQAPAGRAANLELEDVAEHHAAETPDLVQQIGHVQLLQSLWSEVVQLPQAQRSALLLNLRDGDGGDALELLPLSGVASLTELAPVVGMTAIQLAEAWRDLPWEDARIAEHLGISRQQVVNLRKSARARLGRRLRHLMEGAGIKQQQPKRWEYQPGLRIVD